MLEHLKLALSREREAVAIPKMRKHIAWYLKGLRGATSARQAINMATTADEIKEILIKYFEGEKQNE